MKCQRAEEGERERDPFPVCLVFALLQTRSAHSHPRTFAPTVLSAVPVSSPTSFLIRALLPRCSHGQSRPPNPPALLCSFVLLSFLLEHFFFCYLKSYYLLWLLVSRITLPKERLSSVRADIALSGAKARVARWEVDRRKGVKGSTSS